MKITIAILLCLLLSAIPINTVAQDKGNTQINKYVMNGAYAVAKNDKLILSYNANKGLIPASIWKLVTALAALETLGQNYRFKTELFLDSKNNLYIKGFGDPFLISEEVDLIFKELANRGVVEVNNIYLDSSSFSLPNPPPGVTSSLNPYDVINGALAVNFNTINFYVDAKGSISSAEKQTPTLLLMKELGRGFKKGKHRINISRSPENISRHTGELFRAFQKRHKIPGKGTIANKKVSDELPLFYVHYSAKKLTEIIKAMMLYSNNYIANQIYLTMGANEYGYPATWEKSEKYLRNYLDQNLKEYSGSITFDEGSGISRNNRITPRAMIEVLERFKPFARLLPKENGRLVKSGTLKGVYSYAGYFIEQNRYDSFVIILNQKKNYRDKILELLEKGYEGRH